MRASCACGFGPGPVHNCCPSGRSSPESGCLRRKPPPTVVPTTRSQSSPQGVEQLRTLALYDVLSPDESGLISLILYGSRRRTRRRTAERRGRNVSQDHRRCARARAAGDEPVGGSAGGSSLGGARGGLARTDGQLLLPLEGSDADAVEVFARAEEYEQVGDLELSERLYDLAARLDRDDPVIPFNLGNVLDELGRERDAEIAYRQALARDPNFPDAWFNLGVLQEVGGMKPSRATTESSQWSLPMPMRSTTPGFSSCVSIGFRRRRSYWTSL